MAWVPHLRRARPVDDERDPSELEGTTNRANRTWLTPRVRWWASHLVVAAVSCAAAVAQAVDGEWLLAVALLVIGLQAVIYRSAQRAAFRSGWRFGNGPTRRPPEPWDRLTPWPWWPRDSGQWVWKADDDDA